MVRAIHVVCHPPYQLKWMNVPAEAHAVQRYFSSLYFTSIAFRYNAQMQTNAVERHRTFRWELFTPDKE